MIKNDLFLRAAKKLPVERTPIWIMRQAGRYLPEYRAVRAKSDFLTMCKTPELAAEVTLQPIDIIGVDAAIIFSDILVIPEAMGMELIMEEGIGPIFPKPVRNEADAAELREIGTADDLKYVFDAISLTKKILDNRVPLIGFCGSPWTLLTYMVEGGGSKSFSEVKKLIFSNPRLAHLLLDKITNSLIDYLNHQMDAGADAVQIFDTWGGILSQNDFQEFSLRYISKLVQSLNKKDQPVIVFAKGVFHNLDKLADTGADVIGLDWTMDLGDVKKEIGHKVALQGNLDPTVLYADQNTIKRKTSEILESFGKGNGHIFNLGHGILPDVPPENAKFLVDYVKEESRKFKQSNN